MNTASQFFLLHHGMRALRVLAGFCVFSLLYASCDMLARDGEFTREELDIIKARKERETIKDVNAITTNGSANQASALSQGGLSGVGQVCAPSR